jgi:hypothetical protein
MVWTTLREPVSAGISSLRPLSSAAKLSLSVFALALSTAVIAAVNLTPGPEAAASTAQAAEDPPTAGSISAGSLPGDRCAIGSEASNFVCRNAWIAHGRYTYR